MMRKRMLTSLTFLFILGFASPLWAQSGASVQYVYDALGRLTTVVDPSGNVATYNYDAVGNLLSITRSTSSPSALAIFGFSPSQGSVGQTVAIQGQNFSTTASANTVKFNGTTATVTSATTNQLTTTVPAGATTGPISITVGTSTATSSSNFTVLAVPVITSVIPTSMLNAPTSPFTVNGSNLTGATFSFVPAFTPAAIFVSNVNINGNGTSATMTLTLASNAAGSFTVVATNGTGSTSAVPSISNTLTVVSTDPFADSDGDGLSNIYEAAIGTNYAAASTTGDGLPDGWALFYTSAPPLNAALAGQTAPNGLTYLQSFQQGLNPLLNTVAPSVPNGGVYPPDTTTNYPTNGVIVVRFTEPLMAGVSLTAAQSAISTALPTGSNFSAANASAAAQVLQAYLQRTCCRTTAVPGTVQILQNGKPVAGNVYLSNDRLFLTFAPTRFLSASTTFTVSVQGVQDAGGHVMTQPFQSTFTTGLSPSLTTPGAGFTDPANGATGVEINSPIRMEFSSPVNPATLTSQTFSVADLFTGNGAVSGMIQVDPFLLTASFVPSQPWGVGRPIRATFTSGITDFAGHSFFPNGTTLSFTTGFASDTQGLTLVSTSPSGGSTNVPLNALVILEFGEPIDGISALNGLQVQQAGVPIPGAIALSDGNKRLTFTPSAPLAANSTYLVVTTPRLTDFAGNALSNPDTSTFTTGSTTDTTQPSVVTVSPANGATGVPTNALVQAQFSKRIDPITVISATFSVFPTSSNPPILVAGTYAVSADGLTATFTPSAPLAAGTSYTIQLTSPIGGAPAIADLEGITLASFASTTFTTGAGTVTAAPTVLTVSPPSGATGVPINPKIDVVASAPISAASPWSTAVILSTGNVTVPGTPSLNLTGDRTILTFVPTNLLAVSTTYTISVSGFTDQAGNLVMPRTTSFTTGTSGVANTAQPSVVPPPSPAAGAMGVPVTSSIALTFNEAIDPTTVNSNTVPVTLNSTAGAVLAGSYAVSGTTVTFTPLTALPGSTLVFVAVPVNGLQDLSGNKNVSVNFSSSFTTASVTDTTAPQVVATPNNGATGIGLNATVVLTFSKSVNPNTINSNTVGLLANGTKLNVSIAHSSDNRVVSLTPLAALLPASSTVTVVATNGVQDLSGNALANFESQFTTAAAFDTAHPSVLSQRPGNMATGVPVDATVVLYVNEAMNTATIQGALHVSQNGVLVAGTTLVTDGGQTIQFTPSSPFAYSARVQVFLDNTALDVDGSSLTNYNSSFTTVANPSTTAPSVVSTNPLSASGVPINIVIDVGFNQTLNSATVIATNVFLQQGGTTVPSTPSLLPGGTVIQIKPTTALAANTAYAYQITSGVQNANGSAFAGRGFSFVTGAGPDNSGPTIVSVSPHNGLSNVGDNAAVSLAFSKPINQLTVSGSTIQLTYGVTTEIPDSINFSNNNQNVQLVPHAPLPDATLMTLTISGVTDVAGNAVAQQTTQFTTGTGPDVVTPAVVAESPYNTESSVPLNTIIQVQTNDPIDPTTVTSSSFLVFDSTASQTVAGSPGSPSVSADGQTVTFVPGAPLAANHTISVNAGNQGIKNLVGNPLATGGLSAFLFSTGTAADTTGPQVSGISPPNGMTGVPINAQVAIQFNEPVDALTINQVTLTGGGTVNVTRMLTSGNQILLLTPVVPLSPSTTYTVTVTGIQDVSGNSLGAPVTQTFTTGPGADLTPPIVATVNPASNATGVLRNSVIQLQFSKQIVLFMVTNTTFTVRPSGGQPIAGTIMVSANGLTATFTPSTTLAASTQYQISATNGITDLEGQPLTSFSSFFTTGTQ